MRRIIALMVWGMLAVSSPAQIQQMQPMGNNYPPTNQPAAAAISETIQSFVPQMLQLSWTNRGWRIMYGDVVIKDFGTREKEARRALLMIQQLGANQHGTIGAPNPVMEYWLINGRAPVWMPSGSLRVQPLDPRLHIDQVQGQWCLRDRARVLFSFGTNADDARLALGVIQKYGFTQVGTLGIGAPLMYLFFGRGDLSSPGRPGMPVSLTGSVAPALSTPTRFSHAAMNADGTPRVENLPANPGLTGAAPAVLPPLVTPPSAMQGNLNNANAAGGMPMRTTLTGQQVPLWHDQPHFGPKPGPLPAAGAESVPFDYRQAQLRADGSDWKVLASNIVLGNFGTNVFDARAALSAVRFYRFTDQWRPGGDPDAPHYYLAGAHSPRGVMLGLTGRPFLPDQVQVRQLENGFAVTDGQLILVHCGSHQQQAEKLAEIIKRDKLDEICTVGHEGKGTMTFFVRAQ